jgi:hypothetical protein
MKVQHLEFENDKAALAALEDLKNNAMAKGGMAHVSFSHGHGPAIIILVMPDDEVPTVPVTTDEAEVETDDNGEDA